MTKVALQDDAELNAIIKRGQERARFGQRNTILGSSPFKSARKTIPQSHLSRQVNAKIAELEFDKFHAMTDPEEWHRIDEVKKLALEQVKDDMEIQIAFQKVGRKQVEPLKDGLDHDSLWPELTDQQRCLAEGLAPFVLTLTEVQQETLRYRYWMNLSQRDTGVRLAVSKKSVEVNERRAKEALKKTFLSKWPNNEEVLNGTGDTEEVSIGLHLDDNPASISPTTGGTAEDSNRSGIPAEGLL